MQERKTMKTKTSFSAIVDVPDFGKEIQVDVELDKGIGELTYDDVIDAIYDKLDDTYGIYDDNNTDDNDEITIGDIVINETDGESYPVISESMDDSKLRASKVFTKYLVLPNARYTLTKEAKLWMELKKNGLIDEDTPFDFNRFHDLIIFSTDFAE